MPHVRSHVEPFIPGLRIEPTPRPTMFEAKYVTDAPPRDAIAARYLAHGTDLRTPVVAVIRVEFACPYVDEMTRTVILHAIEQAMAEQQRRPVVPLRLEP